MIFDVYAQMNNDDEINVFLYARKELIVIYLSDSCVIKMEPSKALLLAEKIKQKMEGI